MAFLGGQFKSATHGQFESAQGGHFDRNLHHEQILSLFLGKDNNYDCRGWRVKCIAKIVCVERM